jgi:hypothetical protein
MCPRRVQNARLQSEGREYSWISAAGSNFIENGAMPLTPGVIVLFFSHKYHPAGC